MSGAGVVTALDLEARTLNWRNRRADGLCVVRDGTLVAVSGMGGPAAERAAILLAGAGVGALVSWGMAGGLDPKLRAGTLCLPSVVVAADGSIFPTDIHWRGILTAAIAERLTVVGGKILSRESAIDLVADKAVAFRDTGAAAVDMESAAIAAVAAARGLPFMAVRAIVDTAADTVPAAVLAATIGGRVQRLRLMLSIMRSPRQLAPLLRLAERYRHARRSLSLVASTGALAPLALAAAAPSRSV